MFDSLRQLVTQLLSLLQVRIELLTTELSGELRRLAVILVWAAVGLLFVLLALLMFVATVIVAFWDTNRLLAVGLVALLFVVLAGLAVWQVLRRVRNGPPLLEGTLAELRRDRAARPETCPSCGRFVIGKGPCECGGAKRKLRG